MVRSIIWVAYLPLAAVLWALFHGDAVQRVRDWFRGVPGEQEVQAVLAELESRDYQLLRDVKVRSGSITRVVIGPPGVFAIETKSWWPMYVSLRHRLINGSWEKERHTQEFRRATTELRERLRAVAIEDRVENVLVLTRVALPSGPVRLHNLTMIDTPTLLPFIETRSERLSPNQVRLAADAIRRGIQVDVGSTTSSQTQNERPNDGTAQAKRRAAEPEASSTGERKPPRRRVRSPERSPTPPARV